MVCCLCCLCCCCVIGAFVITTSVFAVRCFKPKYSTTSTYAFDNSLGNLPVLQISSNLSLSSIEFLSAAPKGTNSTDIVIQTIFHYSVAKDKQYLTASVGQAAFNNITAQFGTAKVASAEYCSNLQIQVYLPPMPNNGQYYMELFGADVSIQDPIFSVSYLNVQGGKQDVSITGLQASQSMNVATTGYIRLTNVTSGYLLMAQASTGNVYANDCIVQGTANLGSTSGDVYANNLHSEVAALSATMGDLFIDQIASSQINFGTTSGDSHFSQVLVQGVTNITGSATTGDIFFELPAGYSGTFDLQTTLGMFSISSNAQVNYSLNSERHKEGTIGSSSDLLYSIEFSTTSGDIDLSTETQ